MSGIIISQVMKILVNLVLVLNIAQYAQCLLFMKTIAFVIRLADTQVRNHHPRDSDSCLKTKSTDCSDRFITSELCNKGLAFILD